MPSAIEKWVIESLGGGDPGALERAQLEKLKKTLSRAKEKSSFYAESLTGVDIDALDSLTDLENLPYTTGRDIGEDALRMLCVPLTEVERIVSLKTSGTMGDTKRIYFTRRDLERTVEFFSAGMPDVLCGADSCRIFLSGGTENSIAKLLANGLERIGVRSGIHGNIEGSELAYRDARDFGCYVGMPGEMLYLCRTYPQLRPSSVLLSADYIPESAARAIESTWQCRVFSHYGMTETCYGFAVQCAHRGGMHIRSGEFIAEVIDPDTGVGLPPGCEGEIVITSLENEALPLIRYRTGDIGSIAASGCGCRGSLPTISRVKGRLRNLRQAVNVHMLDELLFSIPQVRNYTAVAGADAVYLTVDTVDGGPLANTKFLSDALEMRAVVEYAPLGPSSRGKRRIEYTLEIR